MFSRSDLDPLRLLPAPRRRGNLLLATAAALALNVAFGAARAGGPETFKAETPPDSLPDGGASNGAARASALSVTATKAALTVDGARTVFALDLSLGVDAEVVTLANPYRVVIDLPKVSFRLPAKTGARGKGLVSAFRYGLFAGGKSRVVLDAKGPVRVEKAEMLPEGAGVRLSITLSLMEKKAFGAGTGAARRAPAAPASPPVEPSPRGKDGDKPVVVIDPGHGGIDPGATGPSNLLEKNVVLAVGRELGKALAASGRYEVHFTRSTDVFVALKERVALSRRLEADLFISLHADAIEAKAAQSVRGASVYTLSERASDEAARLRAERENASDLLAGVEAGDGEERDEVMSILLDLLKRESTEFSADFANILAGRLVKSTVMSREARRSAAFTVLKQTHAPSVLLELGYMSHADDEKLMTSPEWRQSVSRAITAAIDAYFEKRQAGARQ